MDVRAMNFADDTFDAVIDKATFDSILVSFILYSVWRKLNHKCRKDDFRDIQSFEKERSIYYNFIRTAWVQTQLLIKARVWMDSEGAANPQANYHFISVDCIWGQGVTKCALCLHLQEEPCMICKSSFQSLFAYIMTYRQRNIFCICELLNSG